MNAKPKTLMINYHRRRWRPTTLDPLSALIHYTYRLHCTCCSLIIGLGKRLSCGGTSMSPIVVTSYVFIDRGVCSLIEILF